MEHIDPNRMLICGMTYAEAKERLGEYLASCWVIQTDMEERIKARHTDAEAFRDPSLPLPEHPQVH